MIGFYERNSEICHVYCGDLSDFLLQQHIAKDAKIHVLLRWIMIRHRYTPLTMSIGSKVEIYLLYLLTLLYLLYLL